MVVAVPFGWGIEYKALVFLVWCQNHGLCLWGVDLGSDLAGKFSGKIPGGMDAVPPGEIQIKSSNHSNGKCREHWDIKNSNIYQQSEVTAVFKWLKNLGEIYLKNIDFKVAFWWRERDV
jgi:hypothetical protein